MLLTCDRGPSKGPERWLIRKKNPIYFWKKVPIPYIAIAKTLEPKSNLRKTLLYSLIGKQECSHYFQGYLHIASYVFYFVPGRLKLHTETQVVPLYKIRQEIDLKLPTFLENTRRWLPRTETPYPGYCRSPGSSICLPILCNCERLKLIWRTLKTRNHSANVRTDEMYRSIIESNNRDFVWNKSFFLYFVSLLLGISSEIP